MTGMARPGMFRAAWRIQTLLLVVFVNNGLCLDPEVPKQWAALSGGDGARVVYWSSGAVAVADLRTGVISPIINSEICSPAWSPDGRRILIEAAQNVRIVNADGTGLKTTSTRVLYDGMNAGSWHTDNWVVYSLGRSIIRKKINPDNSAGESIVLVSEPPRGTLYTSVVASGDYLAFIDALGNLASGGWHRPVVLELSSGARFEPVPPTEDGCMIRLKTDGSGVSIFHHNNHDDPAPVVAFGGPVVGYVKPLSGHRISGIRWSNVPDYLAHNGDLDDRSEAWVRKVSTGEAVYLGGNMFNPDIWIGESREDPAVATPVISPRESWIRDSLVVAVECADAGAVIRYTINGSDPDEKSQLYSGSFVIRKSLMVKARAWTDSLRPSHVATQTYVLDPDRPLQSGAGGPALNVFAPSQSRVYHPGDSLRISWSYDEGANRMVVIALSLDDGKSFPVTLFPQGQIMAGEIGEATWIVPFDTGLGTDAARVKVYDYDLSDIGDVSDVAFQIQMSSHEDRAAPMGYAAGKFVMSPGLVRYAGGSRSIAGATLRIIDLRGRIHTPTTLHEGIWALPQSLRGTFVIELVSPEASVIDRSAFHPIE